MKKHFLLLKCGSTYRMAVALPGGLPSSGLVYAYVESEMEDGISEIMAEPRDGGLIRLG